MLNLPWKAGTVTVAGRSGDDLAPGTKNSILKQAGSSVKSATLILSVWLFAAPRTELVAQSKRVALPRATAFLSTPLTYANSIRELSDGRVLIGEVGEKRLIVADLRSGSVLQVGRIGSGPQEYPSVLPLFPIGRDSTAMVDSFRRRWLILSGATIVATLPPDAPAVAATFSSLMSFDTLGQFVTIARHRNATDSEAIVRVSWANGRVDTVGHLPPPIPGAPPGPQPAFPTQYETVAVAPDGWIAVVRASPYRVDWRDPSGRWVLGNAIAFQKIKVTEKEKLAFASRRTALGRNPIPDSLLKWPTEIPPVVVGGAMPISSDGKILVPRTPTADRLGTWYDVVNRRGLVERQVDLLPNQYVLGFGRKAVYIVSIDADGLQHLTKHPWP